MRGERGIDGGIGEGDGSARGVGALPRSGRRNNKDWGEKGRLCKHGGILCDGDERTPQPIGFPSGGKVTDSGRTAKGVVPRCAASLKGRLKAEGYGIAKAIP